MAGKRPDRPTLTNAPGSGNGSYEVGYARPPASTRFQPGRSGNPKGRPKGRRNKSVAMNDERLKTLILAEAYRSIKINDGGKQVTVPMAKAVLRSISLSAVKGHHRAQKLFSDLVARTEAADKAAHDRWLQTAIEYKINWEEELERRRRFDITDLPEPLPHPDHIVIDMNTGQVRLTGPFTKEEKQRRDALEKRRDDAEAEIRLLTAEMADPDNAELRTILESELRHFQSIRDSISKVIGK